MPMSKEGLTGCRSERHTEARRLQISGGRWERWTDSTTHKNFEWVHHKVGSRWEKCHSHTEMVHQLHLICTPLSPDDRSFSVIVVLLYWKILYHDLRYHSGLSGFILMLFIYSSALTCTNYWSLPVYWSLFLTFKNFCMEITVIL